MDEDGMQIRKRITAAIVDNDKFFSNHLLQTLEKLSDEYKLEIEIHILESAKQCLMSQQTYDFYFVSLEVSEQSSIELAHKLRERQIACELILYSDSEEEMRRAFFVKPCAFIRKWHLESDLREAFSALKYLFQSDACNIPLMDNKRSITVNQKELVYLKSEGHYVQLIFTTGEKQVLRNTMTNLLAQLGHLGFVRIHISYIVNNSFINGYENGRLLLKNGKVLPVSKKYRKQMSEYGGKV